MMNKKTDEKMPDQAEAGECPICLRRAGGLHSSPAHSDDRLQRCSRLKYMLAEK